MFYNNILEYFPQNIKDTIDLFFKTNNNYSYNDLEEIRLRVTKPLILKFNNCEKVFEIIIKSEEIIETLQYICNNSIYSYQNQICNGYITLKGGHRVGLTGNVAIENNKVININYISSLNFRISKQIIGCSNKILKYVLDVENNTVFNTLIVSPPCSGKTTILRDLLRKISSGMENINFAGVTVGLVDERGEIAAMYKGIPQNDLGIRTDVLDNVPKAVGMKMLIRTMAPKVIASDEIGTDEDIEAINYAVCSGIKGVFTAHGATLQDLKINPCLNKLLKSCVIEKIIFLSNKLPRGDVDKVYSLNKMSSDYMLI